MTLNYGIWYSMHSHSEHSHHGVVRPATASSVSCSFTFSVTFTFLAGLPEHLSASTWRAARIVRIYDITVSVIVIAFLAGFRSTCLRDLARSGDRKDYDITALQLQAL